MPITEKFRLNYFVGGGLALGGDLRLEGTKIVFSPTSALDRAMGAKDVEISFEQIRGLDYMGVLSRSFQIKTDIKVHKFEGGQAKTVWERLGKKLPNKGLMSPLGAQAKPAAAPPPTAVSKSASGLACEQCAFPLQPGYSFCPRCATRIKITCKSCHKTIDPRWAACAFCGWKFTVSLAA